jgi:transketolase
MPRALPRASSRFRASSSSPRKTRPTAIGSRHAPWRVGIEAAVRQGWDALIGADGIFVGMTGFGASGPYEELYRHFGITSEAVVDQVKARLGQTQQTGRQG